MVPFQIMKGNTQHFLKYAIVFAFAITFVGTTFKVWKHASYKRTHFAVPIHVNVCQG